MNTKNITDKVERKKAKRAARKKAAPKAKRAAGVARGSNEEEDPSPGAGPAEAVAPSGAANSEPLPHEEHRRADRRFRRAGKRLRQTLGPWSLTALGIGAVIGSGIFTLTGTAAAGKVIAIKSILNATVLDLVLYGTHAGSQMGQAGRRARPSRSRSCWWRSPVPSPGSATPNWPR